MKNLKNSFLKHYFPVIIYAALIFWASSREEALFDMGIEQAGFDKLLHIAEYSVFGFLLMKALTVTSGLPVKALIFISLIIGSIYGVLDEWHQYYVPGRTASVLDLISDSIGTFLGALIFTVFKKDKING